MSASTYRGKIRDKFTLRVDLTVSQGEVFSRNADRRVGNVVGGGKGLNISSDNIAISLAFTSAPRLLGPMSPEKERGSTAV